MAGSSLTVKVGIVGQVDRSLSVDWPEGWPLPHLDDPVELADGTTLYARSITWYPQGSTDEGFDPCIYLVLGNRRPR